MRYWLAMLGLGAQLIILCGCDRTYLSIVQRDVDARYLASSHVGTPDPRQKHPPEGKLLIIDWRIPSEILRQKPEIVLDLIFWDYSQERAIFPIDRKEGYVLYRVLDEKFAKTQGVLSYKAAIVLEGGKVYKNWQHQLWFEVIHVEEESAAAPDTSASSALKRSSSVESQSRQGSVMETP